MHWVGWIIIVIAVILGGWLAFDGGRALIVGDYITPKSGDYAGQLGPWAKLVSAVGIAPRSTLMQSIHVAIGLAWLVATACFILRLPGSWWAMLALAVLTLWYLPFGTLLGLVLIVLLILPPMRSR